MEFNEQLQAALRGDPSLELMEYRGRSYTRGDICALADRVVLLLDQARAAADAKVGIVTRNRVLHAAAILGLIAHRRALTSIYAMQSVHALAQEVASSRFTAVIADAVDWTGPVRDAAATAGSAGIALSHESDIAMLPVAGLERAGPGPFARPTGEPGVEVLSSGTTGKPKRILFPFRMLVRAVETATIGRSEQRPEPDILCWPYGGIGGLCNLVGGTMIGRHTTILEKFNVPEWVDAVRRRRPTLMSGQPAIARMILDAKVAADDLSSIRYFYGGSAPMPPELQIEFERTYGIKVIWGYGATEFCGTIIRWTPQLYERHRDGKMGAMGCALPGVQLRVTDVSSGEPLPPNEVGYLEALVPVIGQHWIRTTDLVLIDEDGFVFHKGRGDGAIVRGGFKVLPETIVAAMQKHPAVLDAAVVGLRDQRLGEVPVCAVEVKSGVTPPEPAELRQHARRELAAHQVPVRFLIVKALPRTSSLKVDLAATKALFETEPQSAA